MADETNISVETKGALDFFSNQKPSRDQRRLTPLQDVVAYENEKVVRRFLKLYDVSYADADEIFLETRKFLWACGQSDHMLEPSLIIDEMWHNFILFTADYADFCQTYFGYFIHHNPTDKAAQRRQDPKAFRKRRDSQFHQQCSTVYDLLGESTVIKWYLQFPIQFDSEFFQSRTKPPNPRHPNLVAQIGKISF